MNNTYLYYTRLSNLIISILIVIGSLGYYSYNSTPLKQEMIQHNASWIIQTITDRRLISTLVAAQASIFCPLFLLLSPSTNNSFIEILCQFLMPVGLALSWIFSILFDLKSKELLLNQDRLCLINNSSCFLFSMIFYMKFTIVLLFTLETLLILYTFMFNRKIQLPLDDAEKSILAI